MNYQDIFNETQDVDSRGNALIETMKEYVSCISKEDPKLVTTIQDQNAFYGVKIAGMRFIASHNYTLEISGDHEILQYFVKNEVDVIPLIARKEVETKYNGTSVAMTYNIAGHFAPGMIMATNERARAFVNKIDELTVPLQKAESTFKRAVSLVLKKHDRKAQLNNQKTSNVTVG